MRFPNAFPPVPEDPMKTRTFLSVLSALALLALSASANGQMLVAQRPARECAASGSADRNPGCPWVSKGTLPSEVRPVVSSGRREAAQGAVGGMVQADSAPVPLASGTEPRDPGNVTVVRQKVAFSIVDGAAVVDVEQVFFNPRDWAMEGTYLCPLPAGAAIRRFSIFLDGMESLGQLVGRKEARSEYEKIVRARTDPGLLEFFGADTRTLHARIFPIPARGEFRVRLQYAFLLPSGTDRWSLTYPADCLGPNAAPLKEGTFSLSIRSARTVRAVLASEGILRDRKGSGNDFTGRLAFRDWVPDGPLQIACCFPRSEPQMGMHVFTTPGGDSYFMATVSAGPRDMEEAELAFEGVEVRDVHPARFSRLGAGTCRSVFGRLQSTTSSGEAVLKARILGREESFRFAAAPGPSREDNSFIPALWALERIRALEDARKRGGSAEEGKKEIAALAKEHCLLTEDTAFFAK
jgi:hypothetical protein